jgi:hypothetical protein
MTAARRQGWLGVKLRAQRAVLAELPETFARRRRVQATRRIATGEFAARLTASLDSPFLPTVPAPGPALLQRGYWDLVRRAIGT